MKLFKKLNNNNAPADRKEKNRIVMLLIAILFILNYIIFCFHTDKNPFDVFPSLPIKDKRVEINIYLPDIDGKSIIKETQKIIKMENQDILVRLLFNKVIAGSEYENTSVIVPVDSYIRKIWVNNGTCIIDVGFSQLKKNSGVINGSEVTFKKALSKTIIENVPSIKKVILLDKGIPYRKIWDTGKKS